MPNAVDSVSLLDVDPVLLTAIVQGVNGCLTMCRARADCVGVSKVPTSDPGSVTGLIGVHGDVSGFITLNLPEKAAVAVVGGLAGERFAGLDSEVVDGVGEMTNIIAGGIKKRLLGTPWAFRHVTVPSVIVGHSYQIAYATGLQYLAATFEHDDPDSVIYDDRVFRVALSLMRLERG